MAKIKDKEALVDKLRGLQGLTNEEKSALIGLLREQKTYGLVWEDKPEETWTNLKDFMPVLSEDTDRRIDNGPDNPNHILIEGDNLNALEDLLYTHEGKVDVIYIDPPYNTGDKDFVYNDTFVDKEDSFKHSKWLSFMSRRLKIARKLLSERGVIFISIDDHQQASMRLLCDEIYGEKALDRGTLIWENKGSTKGFTKIVKNHEYIIAFGKNPDAVKSLYLKNFPAVGERIEERLQIKRSPKNPLCQIKFPKGLPIRDIDNIELSGSIGNGTNRIDIVSGDMVFRNGRLQNDVILEASFPYRNQTEKFFKSLEDGTPVYDTKGQRWREVFFTKTGVPYYSKEREFSIMSSIISDVANSGFSDLKELGLEKKFNNPKPVSLIYRLLAHFSTDTYTILDFFAGSGTTLHATMALNTEDGGHRQCILVTNNENNICEEVTYERNKRVIEGYTTPKGEHVEGLKNNNLRYYKVGFVPRQKTDENMLLLAKNSIGMLCIKNDLYHEEPLGGLSNETKGYRYFHEGDRRMLVILNTDLIGAIVKELEQMNITDPMPTYVYCNGHYPYTDDFEDVREKVDLYPIPYSIYGACEKGMPKMDDPLVEQPDGVTLTAEEEQTSLNDFTKEN